MKKNTFLFSLLLASNSMMATTLVVNKNNPGRTYEGIGALSAGASSRLLPDYQEPYRSQILDYLFKPQYGASLNHLKVEIGGDVNSTCGTEPSHRATPDDLNFNRGYEWWIMKEAKQRNADIKLDILQWGAPYWIGNGSFYSQDNADFIVEFIKGAKSEHNLQIDYAGIWNETPFDTDFIKTLARTFRKENLSTKIVAADEVCSWKIADLMKNDAELMDAIDVIGTHYPSNGSTKNVISANKPVWASEEGATMRGHWEAAKHLIRRFNKGYIEGKIVKQVVWSLVGSYYDILPVPESGLLNARTPWSGQYQLKPALWTIAHYTQFVQPGWIYCESASGYLEDNKSSYVTLYDPAGSDYSIIIETVDGKEPRNCEILLADGMSKAPLHVWRTDSLNTFVKVAEITPLNNKISFEAAPGAIYSLSTTRGQRKGNEQLLQASSKQFPFPYYDDFDRYSEGMQPAFLSDQAGVFETAIYKKNRKVLKQIVPQRGIEWLYHVNPEPHSFIGDTAWTDYTVETEVLLPERNANVVVMGRLNAMYQHTRTEPNSYWLRVKGDGSWELGKTLPALLNGHISFEKEWPAFYARFSNTNQCIRIPYQELANLPEHEKNGIAKAFKVIDEQPEKENLFIEALQWGMYDLRKETVLAKGKASSISGKWSKVSIRFEGNAISAFIGDKKVAEVKDDSFAKGMAGLGCSYNAVYFDNLSIR